MKTPDPFQERPLRAVPSRPEILPAAEAAHSRGTERGEAEFHPRYLDLPVRRGFSAARRNLTWGVGLLFACVPLFGWALRLSGPRAAMTLVSCLATATALYVASRVRLFRQRNGGFLGMAVVCVVAVFISLSEDAWVATSQPEARQESVAVHESALPSSAPVQSAALPPSLVDALLLLPPDPTRAARVKILKDAQVTVDHKTYLIRAGDLFPLAGVSDGEARFIAGDQQIALRQDLVQVLPRESRPEETEEPVAAAPAPNTPPIQSPDVARRIAAAQSEAVHRYPGIGIPGSPENKAFVSRFKEMKDAGLNRDFDNPNWPILLAESLAKEEKWQRQDIQDETSAVAEGAGPDKEAVAEDAKTRSATEAEDSASPKVAPPARGPSPAGDDLPVKDALPDKAGSR